MRARLHHLDELDNMEVDDIAPGPEVKTEEKEVSLDKPIAKRSVSARPESKEAPMELDTWTDMRLDRWLVDWSLRNGFHETANLIAKERNIEVYLIQV
jgi:hypothetical protein